MFKRQKGLTLVELLVVTSIIMILSAVVIPNWRSGGDRLRVIRSAYQIHQDIRRAQELTLASTECSECGCGSNLTYGYGLYFERGSTYDLFGECDPFEEDGTLNDAYEPSLELKEELDLEEKVEITKLTGEDGVTSYDDLSSLTVNFRPPDPAVLIRANGNIIESLEQATIRIGIGSDCREIKINRTGLVEINRCQ